MLLFHFKVNLFPLEFCNGHRVSILCLPFFVAIIVRYIVCLSANMESLAALERGKRDGKTTIFLFSKPNVV